MSFKAREANKRVQIWGSTIVPDTFGGNTVTSALLKTRWCNIEDVGGNSFQNEAGITDFTNTYKFTFRYDVNFIVDAQTHSLKYQGLEYTILDVKTDGFKHVKQIVIAKRTLN